MSRFYIIRGISCSSAIKLIYVINLKYELWKFYLKKMFLKYLLFLTDLIFNFYVNIIFFFQLYYYLLSIWPLQVLPKFIAFEHEIPQIMSISCSSAGVSQLRPADHLQPAWTFLFWMECGPRKKSLWPATMLMWPAEQNYVLSRFFFGKTM